MKPIKVDKLRQVFPTSVQDLMPPKDLVEPYRWNVGNSWGFRLFEDAFYKGIKSISLVPKDDSINPSDAWAHIKTIMGSWEPKHEDKTAACACLFELWFKEPDGGWEVQP